MKRIIREHTRRRAIVNLKTGDTFDGVLYEVDSESLVLRDATAIGVGERGVNVGVDGEVLILRGDIAYIQFP